MRFDASNHFCPGVAQSPHSVVGFCVGRMVGVAEATGLETQSPHNPSVIEVLIQADRSALDGMQSSPPGPLSKGQVRPPSVEALMRA